VTLFLTTDNFTTQKHAHTQYLPEFKKNEQEKVVRETCVCMSEKKKQIKIIKLCMFS